MLVSFAGRCLGARALCFVFPARVAGSSFTYVERSGTKPSGPHGIFVGSYQNKSDMKTEMVWDIAAGMTSLVGVLE